MRCIIILIPHSLTCLARFNLYDLHVADLSWYPQSKVQNNKCGRGDHHQYSFIVLVFMNSPSSSAPPSSSYWSAVRRAEGWRRPCRECGLYNRDHQITPRFKRLAHTPSKACDGAADDEANIEQVGAKHDTGYWSPHSYNCYNLWCVWRLIWQRAAEAQNVKVKCKV